MSGSGLRFAVPIFGLLAAVMGVFKAVVALAAPVDPPGLYVLIPLYQAAYLILCLPGALGAVWFAARPGGSRVALFLLLGSVAGTLAALAAFVAWWSTTPILFQEPRMPPPAPLLGNPYYGFGGVSYGWEILPPSLFLLAAGLALAARRDTRS